MKIHTLEENGQFVFYAAPALLTGAASYNSNFVLFLLLLLLFFTYLLLHSRQL